MENTNTSINFSVIEIILKNNHIFNNVLIVSKPHIIKVLSKLDIVIRREYRQTWTRVRVWTSIYCSDNY